VAMKITTPNAFKDWGGDSCENQEPKDSGDRFSILSGEVEVKRCNKEDSGLTYAKLETILYLGDHVITGEDSYATIAFSDMDVFKLPSESEIVIKSIVTDESKLSVIKGNIMVNAKKMLTGGSIEVQTSQAVTAIKGTTFTLETTNDATILKVLEGTVNYTSKANGKSTLVPAGQTVTADGTGLSEPASFDVEKEKTDWEELENKTQQATQNEGGSACCCIPALSLILAGTAAIIGKTI
jgi:hypothetical protein